MFQAQGTASAKAEPSRRGLEIARKSGWLGHTVKEETAGDAARDILERDVDRPGL